LLCENYDWKRPIRSLGIRACGLVSANEPIQLCLFDDYEQTDRQLKIEKTADIIRKKYGSGSFVLGTSVSTRETSFMPEKKFNPLRRTQ
ncbi:MAG TPA: hypothetical protein PKZ81_08465, partial [Clostridia bacterium]|nr:hypothetical protein [Clostridia bacterium]